MDESAVLKMIRAKCKKRGAQSRLARDMGVSRAFVNDLVLGRRPVTKRVAAFFGLTRAVTFTRRAKP